MSPILTKNPERKCDAVVAYSTEDGLMQGLHICDHSKEYCILSWLNSMGYRTNIENPRRRCILGVQPNQPDSKVREN